jgi:hypothetical protein
MWIGWLREDRWDAWEAVATGATMDAAAEALLEAAASRGVRDSCCRFLTTGRRPPEDWMRPVRRGN